MTSNKIYPKVSIIIPVWNPGPDISRCVESLRDQTLDDIEMIFVDDCGTDSAMEMVRAAAAEDSRIRIIINAENIGPGASRNAGIEAARGEYLSFVDADDYVDSDFMEVLYSKGKEKHLDIVKGTFINELEERKASFNSFNLNDAIQKGLKDGKPLFLLFYYEYQSALYHKRLFVNPDVRYGLTRNAQDTTFLLKACHAAKSLGIDNRVAYHYLYQISSASNSFSEDRLEARTSALKDKAEYLSNHVEPNPYAVQYITRSLKDYLALQRHVAEVGMEREAAQFLFGLRKIAMEYPNIGKVKDLTILALVEYGVGLAERPYHSPWELAQPEDYLDVIVRRTKFLMAHPKYYKEWSKLVSLSDSFVKRMEAEGIPTEKIKWFQKRIKALWHRSSMMWMRFRNNLQPHQSVCDVKRICRKNTKNMKQTIRTFIAKIPLAKSLYHAVKQRRDEFSKQRAQDQLRKKQLIIRQGALECFNGMPLHVYWDVTQHCNFRCSYCFCAGSEYKKDFCTLEQAETAIKHLASTNRPSYQVTLAGGEPTLHPHFVEIIRLLCQYLGDRLEVLQITTNGSFSESLMEAILKAGEQVNVKLVISVHLEYMNVERVVELVKRYSSRTRLQIALMLHPKMVDKAMSLANVLCDLRRDYPFGMTIDMLREPPMFDRFDSRYEQEHFNGAEKLKERFEKMSEEGSKWPESQQEIIGWQFLVERKVNDSIECYERLSLSELKDLTGNSFTGMTCCAGTCIIRIVGDGLVRGTLCGRVQPVCNIFEENPFLREDWMHGVLCTRAMCGWDVNYRIPKFKSSVEAQKFINEKKRLQKKLMGNT